MSELSFTWKGRTSDEMGVAVLRLPDVNAPETRGRVETVSGRDGALFISDGALEEMVLLAECYLPYEQGGAVASLDEIRTWLSGEGWFSQSDIPGRKFRARIRTLIQFQPVMPGFADRIFGLTLYAEPYQYADPEAEEIVLTAGGYIVNPGTAVSRPRIIVEGSGDVMVTVGDCMMEFTGLTDGIVVDSAIMECLSIDGSQLLNGCADMADFPVLKPGSNALTWTGNVSKVTIEPRWRYI